MYIRWVEDDPDSGKGHYEAYSKGNKLSTNCYLIGYINGSDNFGDTYQFNENGTITVTFTEDSYVFAKKGSAWYMTDGFTEATTGATLYAAVGELRPESDGGRGNKLKVPAGTYTFTLTEQGDTMFLSYAEGQPETTEGAWVPVTYVAANEQKPYHDMYAVWVGEFYIYHSGIEGGALETVPITFKGSYDLTARVTALNQTRAEGADKYLYGGYYLANGFTAPAMDEKGIPTATCAAYDGTNWTWTTPVTDKPGNAIAPKGGVTYVIKEVPAEKYLQPYFHFTYRKNSDPAQQTLDTAWLISDIDDNMYQQTGFVIITSDKEANVCSSLTVENAVGGASVLLKPETIFRAKGVTGGYLSYLEVMRGGTVSNGFGTTSTILQYWVTPDGMIVTGTSQRTYGALDTKTNAKANVTTTDVASTIAVFGAQS